MVANTLFAWFRKNGGTVDTDSMGIKSFPGSGNGAVALKDIPEGHTLFTLPRSLTLSIRTSALPPQIGVESWKKHMLHNGWAGLILCMMWEEAQGSESKWSTYFETLPKTFDTPMFWDEEDLKELEGTNVIDKIGRSDAEKDYRDKILAILQERPDLFPKDKVEDFYSMESYHLMGSRILSRSFHVEKSEGGEEVARDPAEPEAENEEMDDVEHGVGGDAEQDEEMEDANAQNEDEDDDEDMEDPADVAMVPIADILNARYGCENAKLFYEEHDLRMVTTKAISKGEQIWNTYGNPPNSDLLRRYGHIDLVPLPSGELGNPADVVEVSADLIVQVISDASDSGHNTRGNKGAVEERVDWWLDEGGDDSFVLDADLEDTPDGFISLIRLLLQPEAEWQKTREKSKPPKPKLDAETLRVASAVLERRVGLYPTTIEDDESLLAEENRDALTTNKLHATVVRFGEKKILKEHLGRFSTLLMALAEDRSGDAQGSGSAKRNGDINGNGKRKGEKQKDEKVGKKTRR